MNKIFICVVLGAFLVGSVALAAVNLNIESIADAGNSADINGRGAVSYDYGISRYEIGIDEFNQFVSDTGVGSATGAAGTPAVNVSWHDAAMFCNWMTSGDAASGAYFINGGSVTGMMSRAQILESGNEFYVLPTLDEWYKAAYHIGGGVYSDYAFGSDIAPIAGTEANYNNINTAPWVLGLGSSEQNGTYDMMGNVYEWTESTNPNSSTEKYALGGSYATGSFSMSSNVGFLSVPPSTQGDQLGFRVVVIPEPGTMSLMGLSTISLFFTRTIRRRKLLGRTLLPIRREYLCDSFDDGEWAEGTDYEGDDYLSVILDAAKAGCFKLWAMIHQSYKSIDKAFWNRMVAMHERKVARRIALRKAVRKKALDSFDAFLAILMK